MQKKPFIIPVFLPHAGCPHRCVFCNQTQTTGQKSILPSVKEIQGVISQFLSYRKQANQWTEISFFGGNFLGLPSPRIIQLLEIANEYIAKGVAHGIRFSTRPDTIDPHRLALVKGYPVTTVELGTQSMNDSVLVGSRRGHTAQDTIDAVALLKKERWRLGLQLMVGLPGDTPATALESGRQVAALNPDFVRIYPCLVLKGSPLAKRFAQGRYIPLSQEQAVDQVKALYACFVKAKITVVRMGLQPTAELNAHAGVIAGPFHPAFGELVYSAIWRDAVEKQLKGLDLSDGVLELCVHPRQVSRLVGHKHMNINQIKKHYGLKTAQVRANARLCENEVMVNGHRSRLLTQPQ